MSADTVPPTPQSGCFKFIAFAAVACFVVLFAPPALYEAMFFLVAGWVLFLRRVIPAVTVDWPQVWMTLVAIVLFVAGLHAFLRWLARGGAPATDTSWRFRQSAAIATLVLVMFAAGTAMVGVAHQVAWLVRSDEPWFTSRSEAARRTGSAFTLRGIGQAVQVYESQNLTLPPGATADDDGRPLHGWMTLLLPYLEEGPLYRRVQFDTPWDSPDNADVFATRVSNLQSPGMRHEEQPPEYPLTDYAANELVIGPGPAWQAQEITDGFSKTIFAGEVVTGRKPWGHPQNWRDVRKGIDPESAAAFGGPWKTGTTIFVFGDTHIAHIASDIDPRVLQALATPNGGETVPVGAVD